MVYREYTTRNHSITSIYLAVFILEEAQLIRGHIKQALHGKGVDHIQKYMGCREKGKNKFMPERLRQEKQLKACNEEE